MRFGGRHDPFPFRDESHHNVNGTRNILANIEIVSSSFDFSLSKKIPFGNKVEKITDIDWKAESFQHHINLLSKLLWISGNLACTISYTKKGTVALFQQTILLPWKKTIELDYYYPPVMPRTDDKKEYLYSPSGSLSSNYEQVIHYNTSPILHIENIRLVTSQTAAFEKTDSRLLLDVAGEVKYRIFQEQIIKL